MPPRRPTAALLLALLPLLLSACLGEAPPAYLTSTPPAAPPTDAPAGSPIAAYFTDPFAPGAASRTGGPDEAIAAAIDEAEQSVDIAIYNFSLDSVAGAVLRAHERGVAVRIVMESDALDRTVPQDLIARGIPIVGDRQEGLMHNKFIVIDRREVWTGSLNLTAAGTYDDYNLAVRARGARLAQNYTTEFEEMFVDDRFGANSPANTPYPGLTIDGVPLEVYFSPDDGVSDRLVELIAGARESVHFLAYSFTSDEIAEAMLERARAGVDVRGVFEDEQVNSNEGTEFQALQRAGLDVRRDKLPGQMHIKAVIVDGRSVSFGSYNFSGSAERRNDENVMIVHDPALAAQFEQQFQRIFTESGR